MDGEMVTKTIYSVMNKGLRRRHFIFGSQEACSLFWRFLQEDVLRRLCVGIVLSKHVSKYFLFTQREAQDMLSTYPLEPSRPP